MTNSKPTEDFRPQAYSSEAFHDEASKKVVRKCVTYGTLQQCSSHKKL